MPLVDNVHYVDSVGYSAVTAWATGTVIAAGALRRPTAAAVGSERVFVAIVGGTTHATTEPTWPTTRGGKVTDNTVQWQEVTGLAGVNGDLTNTPDWTTIKNTAIVLGQLIKRNNGASYQICTTAGTAGNGSEPSFSDTAGTTTADNTVTWTSLGVVGNFTGGQAPHARLANALATNWGAAGNDIYVKSSHAASQSGTITLLGAGTIASPQRVICHNGGAYPPAAANVTTGASETSTGGDVTVTSLGLYMEGVSVTSSAASQNVRAGGANSSRQKIKNCTLVRGSTNAGIILGINSTNAASVLELENVSISFANTSQTMSVIGGNVIWRGGTLTGAAVPTTLITPGGNPSHVTALIDGMDLSAAGSGKTLVGASATASGLYRFANCKLGGSVTPASTPSAPSLRIEFLNCDDGTKNYRNEIYDYAGTLTTETTIVLTGGASDGTTTVSWKVVTTANARFEAPFECPPIVTWNEDTGSSKTLTIQGIWGGGAVPNDDEIWVDVEYLGSASTPIASFVNDAKATVLTTAAAQSAGSGNWGGSTTKFALSASFTPQMKGPVIARVRCAKVSSTFYIDPRITLS